ncbi:unnamed protein product [Symbiodinium sp. CCMP2592]|nr:unnamed protein product [Symbiodinium sp. CCMP2592]
MLLTEVMIDDKLVPLPNAVKTKDCKGVYGYKEFAAQGILDRLEPKRPNSQMYVGELGKMAADVTLACSESSTSAVVWQCEVKTGDFLAPSKMVLVNSKQVDVPVGDSKQL